MSDRAKILLLGKTGVGKSAFINYFVGKDVAKSAVGKPVTKEYFECYHVHNGKYEIEIYDTKGLETAKANDQLEEIISLIKEKNNGDDIFNWFHTIFYCISMSNARFEDFEIKFIDKLQRELTQHIHIILTHCDACTTETVLNMKNQIRNKFPTSNIEIFEVISVDKRKRNGQIVKRSGKEVIEQRVFDLLWNDIAFKVSKTYAKNLHDQFYNLADNTKNRIERSVDKYAKLKTLIDLIKDEAGTYKKIDDEIERISDDCEKLQSHINESFDRNIKPIISLYNSYKGAINDSLLNDLEMDIESAMDWGLNKPFMDKINSLDSDEILDKKLMPLCFKACSKGGQSMDDIDLDDLSVKQLLSQILFATVDLLSLNKNLKKWVDEIYDEFIASIPPIEKLQEGAYKHLINYVKVN